MPGPRLVVEIVGDASELQRELRKAAHETEGFGHKVAKLGKIAAVGAAGIAVATVEIGKKFAEAAITAQEQTGKLNRAFEKTVVMVTHDPRAERFVDAVIRLDKGVLLNGTGTAA